jgi:hypothetical protein
MGALVCTGRRGITWTAGPAPAPGVAAAWAFVPQKQLDDYRHYEPETVAQSTYRSGMSSR